MIECALKNDPLAQAALLTSLGIVDDYAAAAPQTVKNALDEIVAMRGADELARERASVLAGHAIGLVLQCHEAALRRIEEDDALQGGGL